MGLHGVQGENIKVGTGITTDDEDIMDVDENAEDDMVCVFSFCYPDLDMLCDLSDKKIN